MLLIADIFGYYLPYDYQNVTTVIIPYLGILMFTLLNNTIDVKNRYKFALVVGVMVAMLFKNGYTPFIILYPLFAYIGHRYFRRSEYEFHEGLFMALLNIIICEVVIYLIAFLTDQTVYSTLDFLYYRLLPTIVFNLLMYLPIYVIYEKIKGKDKMENIFNDY